MNENTIVNPVTVAVGGGMQLTPLVAYASDGPIFWIDSDGEILTGDREAPECITDDAHAQAKCFRRWMRNVHNVAVKEPNDETR